MFSILLKFSTTSMTCFTTLPLQFFLIWKNCTLLPFRHLIFTYVNVVIEKNQKLSEWNYINITTNTKLFALHENWPWFLSPISQVWFSFVLHGEEIIWWDNFFCKFQQSSAPWTLPSVSLKLVFKKKFELLIFSFSLTPL